jgi:hypothetical protein
MLYMVTLWNNLGYGPVIKASPTLTLRKKPQQRLRGG